jgi:para-nitrobenzyl esterase
MKRVLVIGVLCVACSTDDPLQVKLDSGVIKGAQQSGVRSFLGIPYAAPPLADLRWKVPQPVTPWTGVQPALAVSDPCPQTFLGSSDNEDCLYLNVWSPTNAKKLPVMVWIHGGAFISGSGGDKWYFGDELAKLGVVVVSMNYRLGALGFFAHPALDNDDPTFPTSGNYGLEDQRAALEWVQRNIAKFGGDPAHVTLFGESAGGFSVCAQYVSNRTNGLFEAAISESGLCGATIVAPGHANAESLGLDLAQQLGCTGPGALDCMRAVPVDTLLSATALPPLPMQSPGGPFYQTSVLANGLPNIDGYVIDQPIRQAFASGSYLPRPLVIGNVKDEGTLFHAPIYAVSVDDDISYRSALAVRFGTANVDAIVAHYPGGSTPNDVLAQVTGDAFFVCPSRQAARGAVTAGAPVWRYSFEQPLDQPFAQGLGVFHASEIPFVFGHDDFPLGRIGAQTDLVQLVQTDWTTFAKTQDPGWTAYDAASDPYLVIEPGASMASGLKSALCDFWDALPPP